MFKIKALCVCVFGEFCFPFRTLLPIAEFKVTQFTEDNNIFSLLPIIVTQPESGLLAGDFTQLGCSMAHSAFCL